MLEEAEVEYSPTGQLKKLFVYLPDNYDDTDQRYPVMYLLDGQEMFGPEDARMTDGMRMDTFLKENGYKMILVGIESAETALDRMMEYTPYGMIEGPMINLVPAGDKTMQWLAFGLKPAIDQMYRTLPEREYNGIGGFSLGGLLSAYAAVNYNVTFSRFLCGSPDFGGVLPALIEETEKTGIMEDTKVFISWGTEEAGCDDPSQIDNHSFMYQNNRLFADAMRHNNADVMMDCQIGGRHLAQDWRKQREAFMDFLWEKAR